MPCETIFAKCQFQRKLRLVAELGTQRRTDFGHKAGQFRKPVQILANRQYIANFEPTVHRLVFVGESRQYIAQF